MKVISLLQPWASLLVIGAKQYETRSWDTYYRGNLLIHASGRMPPSADDLLFQEPFRSSLNNRGASWSLPLASIIGMVTVVGTELTGEWVNKRIREGWSTERIKKEMAFGDYSPNRFAWQCWNPILFENPILAKGALSIWNLTDPDALESVRVELERAGA